MSFLDDMIFEWGYNVQLVTLDNYVRRYKDVSMGKVLGVLRMCFMWLHLADTPLVKEVSVYFSHKRVVVNVEIRSCKLCRIKLTRVILLLCTSQCCFHYNTRAHRCLMIYFATTYTACTRIDLVVLCKSSIWRHKMN